MIGSAAPLPRCAPAERASAAEVARQSALLDSAPFLRTAFDCVGETVVIVNSFYQVVFANRMLTGGRPEAKPRILGSRPGEVLGCTHAFTEAGTGRCGTTPFCTTCSIVRAVLESQRDGSAVYDSSISLKPNGEALNLRVRASQIEFQDEQFTVCAMEDISAAVRRSELESVFFHDILNLASAVRGLADAYDMMPPPRRDEVVHDLGNGTHRLVEEIVNFRMMSAAENNELQPDFRKTSSLALVREVAALVEGLPCIRRRTVQIVDGSDDTDLVTDQGLITRVLLNMVKNALEATEEGGAVTIACRRRGDRVRFSVHNASAINREVAAQVFRRSFSTKGPGRGLGTYSMKLFTEKYLDGTVTFQSTPAAGTTFTVDYPLVPATTGNREARSASPRAS